MNEHGAGESGKTRRTGTRPHINPRYPTDRSNANDRTQRIPRIDDTVRLPRQGEPAASFADAPTLVMERPSWAEEITRVYPNITPPPSDEPTVKLLRSELQQIAAGKPREDTSDSKSEDPRNPTPEALVTSALTGSVAALAHPEDIRRLVHRPAHSKETALSPTEFMYQIGVHLVRLEGNEDQRRRVIDLLAHNSYLIEPINAALAGAKTAQDFFDHLNYLRNRDRR
jgi:hypothetical protein